MSFIGKHNIENASIIWPNPFHLKESEIIRSINNIPLEIVTLAIIEILLYRPYVENPLSQLRINGIAGSFSWDKTKDGGDFWFKIRKRNFDIFYQTYTPDKLLERAKELKNIDYSWERKITI